MVRKFPCFCEMCCMDDFENCHNLQYAGKFNSFTMVRKGTRVARSRYVEEPQISDEGDVFIPVSIKGKRTLMGVTQYLVSWEGYENMTWCDADKLDCIGLIENFEAER